MSDRSFGLLINNAARKGISGLVFPQELLYAPSFVKDAEKATEGAMEMSEEDVAEDGGGLVLPLAGKLLVVASIHIIRRRVAIKIMDVTQIKEDYIMRNLYREARIMAQLQHPCIVSLFQTMQNGNFYYLVTELVSGGDLCSFIKSQKYGKLDERNTKVYARQLISALAHMHNLGIVHRDLKMENVMMNSIHTQIKIVDFGLSNVYDPNCPLRTHCGSPEYAAPELFVPGKSYGPEVDLWSLGVILYGMVVGQLPFVTTREESMSSQERRKKLLLQINKGYSTAQRKALSLSTPDFRAMVAKMLVADAVQRMSINELMLHPWVTEKGKKSVIVNPMKTLSQDWQISIMKQVGSLLQLDWTMVRYAINNEPYGDIAGMYNIFTKKIQTQQLEGDGVSKTLSINGAHQAQSPTNHFSSKNFETPSILKKQSERAKSPILNKMQKTSSSIDKPESRPQTAAFPTVRKASVQFKTKVRVLSSDDRDRMYLAADNKAKTYSQSHPTPSNSSPLSRQNTRDLIASPKRLSLSAPRHKETSRLTSPKMQGLRKSVEEVLVNEKSKNELRLLGSRGIPRILSTKKSTLVRSSNSTPKSTQTTVSGMSKIKSRSDPLACGRQTPQSPLTSTTRPVKTVKRSRVVPVTVTQSAPKPIASAPPMRYRRSMTATQNSKSPSPAIECSPQVQGDAANAYKRKATAVPSKHVQIQRSVLTDPIARSIAGYIANNISSTFEGFKWKKASTKS